MNINIGSSSLFTPMNVLDKSPHNNLAAVFLEIAGFLAMNLCAQVELVDTEHSHLTPKLEKIILAKETVIN